MSEDLSVTKVICKNAQDLLLRNKFNEALELTRQGKDESIYIGAAYFIIQFHISTMTFDRKSIAESIATCDRLMELISSRRYKSGWLGTAFSYIKYRNYNHFTDYEVHVELCYAEVLLARAALTFLEDPDSIVSFIKGAITIRNSYGSFRELHAVYEKELVHNRHNPDKQTEKFKDQDVVSGVLFGNGAFQLGLSLLPPKILKLLEFVGIDCNKEQGLELLTRAEASDALRSPLAAYVLLMYQTIVTQVIDPVEYSATVTDNLINKYKLRYPEGAMFLLFQGRRELINRSPVKAEQYFSQCEHSQDEAKQIHHVCWWERMWCHAIMLQWGQAAALAKRLSEESLWSRTTYLYFQLAFTLMSTTSKEGLDEIARRVPKYQLKIGGKHLHGEKFVIRKARSYLNNKGWLCVPGIELLYTYRQIHFVPSDYIQQMIIILEQALSDTEKLKPYHSPYPTDDWFLCHLLLAVLVTQDGQTDRAMSLLRTALQSEDSVEVDHYYIPYAHYELAQLYISKSDFSQAKAHLICAKHFSERVKSYSLENRLLFRIHSSMSKLN